MSHRDSERQSAGVPASTGAPERLIFVHGEAAKAICAEFAQTPDQWRHEPAANALRLAIRIRCGVTDDQAKLLFEFGLEAAERERNWSPEFNQQLSAALRR